MRKQKVLLAVCFWLCLYVSIFAQVSISPTIGCAPQQINFSAPPGVANWDFGNGSTSQQSSGSYVYTAPGTFLITYSGAGGNFSQSIVINTNNITANFTSTVPSSGCLPRVVSFSGSGGGPNAIYQWDFGDGGQGTGASVTHAYGLQGTFTPILTVLEQGCTDVFTGNPIHVSGAHNLIINANPGFASCAAPFTTAFDASGSTSGSPLGGGLTYSWDFGNGQTASGATPASVTYGQGVFVLTLNATDNNNCVNTKTVTVSVVQPTVAITAPTINCISYQSPVVSFPISVQSSQPDVLVNMGDGSPSFPVTLGGTPTFTYPMYTTPGIKTITITASAGNCVATITHTLFVEEITPQFTTTAPFFTCSPTFIRPYQNQTTVNSNASITYTWTTTGFNKLIDPASTTTVTNPTFTFTQGSLNPYAIFGTYKPLVTLQIETSTGCRALVQHIYDSIRRPTAWFNMTKSQGCVPLTVKFRDSSDFSPLFPIQSYTWSNGASPPTYVTGTIPPPNVNPTFVYNLTGTYSPSYTIATAGGCSDVSWTETITVVNPSTLNMAFPGNVSVCAGQPVSFTLSATPATSLISHWHVESDNGFYSNCISNSVTSWPFTHLGVHTVTLSGYDHGCKSDLFPAQVITVNGPVGKFHYRTNCTNKKSVNFYPYLQEATTAVLDYGDLQTETLTGNATGTVAFTKTHVYAATGDYVAVLTTYNSVTGCSFTHSMTVTVREINADFDPTPVICLFSDPQFDASASTDVFAGCGRGYTWFIDNRVPEQSESPIFSSTYSMTSVGTHTVRLLVKDINSCTSTMTKTFRVASPNVDFGFNSNPVCTKDNPVQIINLTPQNPDAVTDYTISLGTGASTFAVTSLTAWPILNTYLAAPPSQTFLVKVWGKNVIGCRDSMEHVLKVNQPSSFFSASSYSTCVGVPVILYLSTGYTNTINYGDGLPTVVDPSGAGSYTHAFTTPGNYTTSLLITDDGACTFTSSLKISVQPYPDAAFVFADIIDPSNTSDVFCTPANISFTAAANSNTLYPITTYSWSLGNGSPIINAQSVSSSYTVLGLHTITLTTSTSNGCSSTVTHSLTLLTVTATPHLSKSKICLGETIQLSLSDTTSVQYWIWSFKDPANNTITDPPIYASSNPPPTHPHTYTNFPLPSGSGTISLYYTAGANLNANCKKSIDIPIQVIKIEPDFIRNAESAQSDIEHCLNIMDNFTNKSKRNNGLALGGLNFLWSFGNGATSTLQSSSYTYPDPGIYTVSLTVTDPSAGCTNTTAKNMTINPNPTATVSVADSVCKNSSFMLYSAGSPDITEYNWIPSVGVAEPHAASSAATASVSTSYSLAVVNKYGCKGGSANQGTVYVQQPPLVQLWDTTIIIGQGIEMNTYQGDGFTYSWSPLTDLSCSACPYPTSSSTVNITYSVEVQDPMKCFRATSTYSVYVDPLTTVDVPTAFTPNGDGVNDVIYVDGWGIKRLIYFKIFNRWGQLLFESNDIKVGWDGTYLGVPQNMETYIYQVSVETYLPEKNLEKTSSFRLIR